MSFAPGQPALPGAAMAVAISIHRSQLEIESPRLQWKLDEPFGALDPGITADLHKLILDLWAANAMTLFRVTRDLKEGCELGTRLLGIRQAAPRPASV